MWSSIFSREPQLKITSVPKVPLVELMEIAVLIGFIAALMAAFVILRPSPQTTTNKKSAKSTGARSTVAKARSPYKSISIVCAPDACDAAITLGDKRLLTSEAPLIPLQNCSSSACCCKYVHHEDRRSDGGDRRAPVALRTELFEHTGRTNMRSENGRRRSDWEFA